MGIDSHVPVNKAPFLLCRAKSLLKTFVPKFNMGDSRSRVFLDVSEGTEPLGRLVIELFLDKAPKTCEK